MAAWSGKRLQPVILLCVGMLVALSGCAGQPTLTMPSFTPTRGMLLLPSPIPTETDAPTAESAATVEASTTAEPTAALPGQPTPVRDGTVPVVPGPVIDVNNVDLLVPLAEIPMEGGGVAWSPDGRTLAVGSHSSVALLTPLSGGEIHSFEAPERTENMAGWWFGAVAFSPEGSEIAGGFDGTVAVWDVQTGTLVKEYPGYAWVTAVAYSPDGRWLAIGASYGGLVVSRKTDRHSIFLDAEEKLWEAAFSPDSHWLVATNESGATLWDLESGTLRRDDVADVGQQMGFSPDSRLLTGGSSIVSTETNEVVRQLPSGDANPICAQFHPGGSVLARGLDDGSIELLDPSTGDLLQSLNAHAGLVLGLAFNPDGRLLASVGEDGVVRLWGLPAGTASVPSPTRTVSASTRIPPTAGRPLPIVPGLAFEKDNLDRVVELAAISMLAGGVAWSPDGETLAVGLRDAVVLLSPLSGTQMRTLETRDGTENNQWRFGAVAFSPDGGEVAGGFGGTLSTWHVGTGRLLNDHSTYWVTNIAYSPDGKWLAYSSYIMGTVLDRRTGKPVFEFQPSPPGMVITAVAFSPDSRYLAGFGFETDRPSDRSVPEGGSIWETGSWQLAREFPTPGGVNLAFSPDGGMIADDQMLVDVDSGEWLRSLECGDYRVCTSVAFHPNGEILAVGLEAGTIRFIDPESGEVLGELAGHADWISGLAFSPDGRLLASVGEDEMVRLWGVPAG